MFRKDKMQFGTRRYMPHLKPKTGWPELTALIDVLFLALLFFALSSSFVRISGISVELPRIQAPNVADVERLVVTVTPSDDPKQSCQVYFQDKIMSFDMLQQEFFKLTDTSSKASIIISADRRVPFDTVARIMAFAESAKISSFIAVAPPDAKRETRFEQR